VPLVERIPPVRGKGRQAAQAPRPSHGWSRLRRRQVPGASCAPRRITPEIARRQTDSRCCLVCFRRLAPLI